MTPSTFIRRRHSMAALSSQASVRRRGIQIGPRIRIGGSVGKVGQKIKEGVGQIAKKAAPFVALIPGVGPLAAGALGAAGTVLDTSHGSVGLGDIAGGAIKSGVAGSLLGKIPGVGSLAGKAGALLSHIPGASTVGNHIGDIANAAGGLLKDHGGDILNAVGGVNSAIDAGEARDLAEKARQTASDNWDSRAGLRDAGLKGMLSPQTADLSRVYGAPGSSGNPYDRAPIPAVGAAVTDPAYDALIARGQPAKPTAPPPIPESLLPLALRKRITAVGRGAS